MSLFEQIKEDLNKAVKGRKETESLVLRQLLASVLNKEKEKRYKLGREGIDGKDLDDKSHLSEEELLEVVGYEAKKRRESIVEFGKGKRDDLVAKEKSELEILEKYLPAQLGKEEIKSIAKEVIAKVGAENQKDIGKVMAGLMPKLKGQADGTLVGRVVRELLS